MRVLTLIAIQASLQLLLACNVVHARGAQTEEPEASEEFDCAIRQLGMDYAAQIQPHRSHELLSVMADAFGEKGGLPGGRTICPHAPKVPEAGELVDNHLVCCIGNDSNPNVYFQHGP
jgi:hypothetical protein